MISTPTALVLGAGASNPYGFPLGYQLTETLRQGLTDADQRRAVEAAGFSPTDLDHFAETFRLSGSRSIDEFLARRMEFAEVGKAAITALVLSRERQSHLHPHANHQDHWYEYLWDRLCSGVINPDDLYSNQLWIVTFNYDRSLQQYLRIAATNLFRKQNDQKWVEAFINNLRFIHVYGSVDGTYGLFDAVPLDERIRQGNSIAIMAEGRNDAPHLQECRVLLQSARRVCYLGFGYDPQNLERINPANAFERHLNPAGKNRRIVGSVYGLKEAEVSVVEKLCGVSSVGLGRHADHSAMRCTELLRETQILVE